jgi:hypothetical protein
MSFRPLMGLFLLLSLSCGYFYLRYLYGAFLAFCTWFLSDSSTGLFARFYNKLFESCEYWWDGCNGYKLHDGKIDSFDIDSQKWNLLLDARDENLPYLMAYEAISLYLNEDSSTFDEYQLPHQVVLEGDDEIETEEGNQYTRTPTSEWTEVEFEDREDEGGRRIDPIEWSGEEVDVLNITDEELKSLRDASGEI